MKKLLRQSLQQYLPWLVRILVEGPLDAGRLGPPAIATMGKFFSEDQAKLVSEKFERVICVPDNDKAGRECLRSVIQRLDPARVTMDVVKLASTALVA